jgi:hypothetical protein
VSTPVRVSDEVLDDLRDRLALTRPPLDENPPGIHTADAWVSDLGRAFRDRQNLR